MPDPDVRANTPTATIGPGQYSGAAGSYFEDNAVAVGETVFPRELVTSSLTLSSGTLRLGYFTATKTEVVTQLRVSTSSTAAGATPTLVRFGIYSVAADGALTLVAATASDTALLAAANTAYTKPLTASFTKQAGVRYAAGLLVVTGAAAPNVPGMAPPGAAADFVSAPRLAANVTGQTDLPASVALGLIADTTNRPQMVLLP